MREQEETLDTEEYVDGQYCKPDGGRRNEGEGRGMGVASTSLHEFVQRARGAEQALAMIQELLQGTGGMGNTRGGNGESVEPQSGTGETPNEGVESETGVSDKNETSQSQLSAQNATSSNDETAEHNNGADHSAGSDRASL